VSDSGFSAEQLRAAVLTPRFAALARADVDLATWKTWDHLLPRNKRILVPIDVQALVVPAQGGEPTVAVGAVKDDPAPFDPGSVRPAGVHLHWALPDALLRGENDEATKSLRMDPLPDRWVVVRTLLPEGARTAYASGWVVDAVHGVVVPLASYAGTIDQALIDAATGPVLSPLDGSSRGTLLWSATYQGAENRFALHDPLTDLKSLEQMAPNGFHRGRAVYTVAGWWTDAGQDPLAGTTGTAALDRRLAQLGWYVTGDGEDDLEDEQDPKLSQLATYAGLSSPATTTKVTTVTQYSESAVKYSSIEPKMKLPVENVSEVFVGLGLPNYHSMLHGSVLGVPIDGTTSGTDDRPDPKAVTGSLGLDIDDIAAALAGPGFGLDAAHRQTAERLSAAFTGDLLSRIGTSDGLSDLEEREHSDGFWGMPGRPVVAAKPDRLRTEDTSPLGPTQVGRKGRAALLDPGVQSLKATATWKTGVVTLKSAKDSGTRQQKQSIRAQQDKEEQPTKTGGADAPASRDVVRAAPRMFRPAPAMVGLRGIRPSLRHHGDGLFDDHGLRCRYPGEVKAVIEGTVDGANILPTLGNGAIPPEVLRVVREAVVLDGYSWKWLAAAGKRADISDDVIVTRVIGEMVRLYGTQSRYDSSGAAFVAEAAQFNAPQLAPSGDWSQYRSESIQVQGQVASEFARFSLAAGTPPSPVALTTWRQPWVPLFVEWQVRLEGSDQLTGWSLAGTDLEPAAAGAGLSRTLIGRSPITTGVAKALTAAIDQWLAEERMRDATVPSSSQLDATDQDALNRLSDLLRPLDVVSGSLDGVREQLLGIPYTGLIIRTKAADGTAKPPATELPVPLFGGTLTVEKLRVVDAFGRLLDLPADALVTTTTLEVQGKPSTIRLRPRIQNAARWLLRLVDPGYSIADDPAFAPEAYVDQLRAALAVSPVSGFLLPDHIDEALEVFDRDGNPIGQVMHDSVTDAVTWETAPGRPLPPDAGPLADVPPHAQHASLLVAGLIQSDIDTRHSDAPPAKSSLTALLRAIDSTLWSVDTYAAIGSPTIAGLVGRPIAVVRATLRLDAPDDVDEVDVTEAGGPDARRAAFETLAGQQFPFRIGELGRSDDGVLGFFVDDDYTRFRVVDKVVASAALASGRHTGHLGLLGAVPDPDPIEHPYLDLKDTVLIRPGQTIRLTVLMLPAGKIHLTSGILPRKALELADEWVTPGLMKVVPSMRVGPLLVDPAEIRLPNVASLGTNQQFTRRTGPLTWKDDPILASTTNAYLPKMAHEAQEGWIRVAPAPPPSTAPGAGTP
jgi:hypothetical protein